MNLELNKAINNSQVHFLQSYVENGGDYLSKDCHNETPFYISCKEGKFEHVSYLVNLIDINIFEMCNDTNALYAATFGGNIDIVKLLLTKGYDSNQINLRQKEGCTAFYCACQMYNIEIAQYLLDNGAEIDIPDEDGNTSLKSAVVRGNFELFTFLLDRGANPLFKDNNGETCIQIAQFKKRNQMRKIMEIKIGYKIPKQKVSAFCENCHTMSDHLLKCSRCMNAAYCNADCQKCHWKTHKVNCIAPHNDS